MRLEQLKFIASLDASDDSPSESLNTQASKILEEQAQLICSLCHEPDSKSPVSYLVLLQVRIFFLKRFQICTCSSCAIF